MDSSLIGVIIGGLIAVIPVVLNGFFEAHRQRAQFVRDRALREIDLIDTPRLLNAEMVLKCGNDPEDSARRIK